MSEPRTVRNMLRAIEHLLLWGTLAVLAYGAVVCTETPLSGKTPDMPCFREDLGWQGIPERYPSGTRLLP